MDTALALSDLQQAALDCIERCERELAISGYKVRSAIELEFIAKNQDGTPAQINLGTSSRFAQQPEIVDQLCESLGQRGAYIQQLSYEALDSVVTRYLPKARYSVCELQQGMRRYFWRSALRCLASA